MKTVLRAPAHFHLIRETLLLLLCTTGALTGAEKTCCPAPVAVQPAACCSAKETPQSAACCPAESKKPEACCEPMAAAPFSRDSIYQLDVTFTADTGRTFALGELRGRPVALAMFFTSCGYACPLTVTDLLAMQAQLPAELRAKTTFILVSFDPARDTTEALARYRAQRQLDGQWILLRGGDDAVRELAALLGVKYKQEADGQFAHSNLVTILNAEGEIIHRRVGLKGGVAEAAAALTAVQSK